MPNASTTFASGVLDVLGKGRFDPSIPIAVEAIEALVAPFPPLAAIPNVVGQTVTDELITTTLTLTSGTVQATLMNLRAGTVVNNVNVNSNVVSGTLSHAWVAITDMNGKVLAVSANKTSGTSTSLGVWTFAITGGWTVPTSGQYYVHIVAVAATTQPTLDAQAAPGGLRATQVPITSGTGATGQTTPPAIGATLTVTLTATKGIAAYLN